MTAPIIYDDNFSIQLVPSHKHTPDVDSLAGDEVVCAVCGSPLLIICPNNHPGALDKIRYSGGPVARAPRTEDKLAKRRQCRDCPREMPRHSRDLRCPACKAKALARMCKLCNKNELRKGQMQPCDECRAVRDKRRPTPRKPIPATKVCRTCHIEKPIEEFAIVYAHYRVPDCRQCKNAKRRAIA